ncbi:hypothetical protein AB4156_27790 [Cupriavidus sp. 2MCAB6]|uniref:hypothetical protein n=1 Tax=Cupriavidus sp. 2MCAB6 TaxID=3232981 RepID=UPI003F8FD650
MKTQRVCAGYGNLQIDRLVVLGDAHINTMQTRAQVLEDGREPYGHSIGLGEIVLAIEKAEETLVDGARVWRALTRHLSASELDETQPDNDATVARHWAARSYLVNWLTCRRGDALTRAETIGQIVRMWDICPDIRTGTQEFSWSRYRTRDLAALNDVQLRAALWVTLADWRAFWLDKTPR